MDDSLKDLPTPFSGRKIFANAFEAVVPLLAFLLVSTAIFAPRSVAWLLPALGGVSLLMLLADGQLREIGLANVGRLFLAAAALAAASALWSMDPRGSLQSAIVLASYTSLTAAFFAKVSLENDATVDRLALAFAAAVAAGSLLMLFELLTSLSLHKALFTYVPVLKPPNPAHVGMLNDRVAFMADDELNRNVGIINLLLWPALALLTLRLGVQRARLPSVLLFAVVALVTFRSPHESSKIALVAGIVAFILFQWRPRAAILLATVGWISAIVLVVPAAYLAHRAGLNTADALQLNARVRVDIWRTSVGLIAERPLLGIGANATRYLSESGTLKVARHPHNVYLQTWQELGLAGAVLLLAIGLAILRWIGGLGIPLQGFALAAFCSAATMNAFSWSLWQTWLQGALCLSAVLLAAAWPLQARSDRAVALLSERRGEGA